VNIQIHNMSEESSEAHNPDEISAEISMHFGSVPNCQDLSSPATSRYR
jgi:hypothetical protein